MPTFLDILNEFLTMIFLLDCPGCVLLSLDTNFTAILSFESKVLLGAK